MVGLPGKEVSAAGAAVCQEAAPRQVTALDLGTVRGSRADHQPSGLLLDPPKRRDVIVGPEQDARLTCSRLGRQVGLPLGQPMCLLRQPAGHVGRASRTHRPLQHREREPVDLEKDDPRSVGLHPLSRATGNSLSHPQRVRVVVVRAEEGVQADPDRRREQGNPDRRPERLDVEVTGDAVGSEEHERVDHQQEREAGEEHERQPQRRDDGRQDGVQDRYREDGDQGSAEIADGGAEGACAPGVIGTYLHGAFENADVCAETFGIDVRAVSKSTHYRRLGEWFSRHGRLDLFGF